MAEPDFDPEKLATLIAEALEEHPEEVTAVSPADLHPFAFGDTRMLERLSQVLPNYLEQPDVAVVLDELRTELYDSVAMGTTRDLHAIVKNCRKCPSVSPDPQMPVWNLVDPDVVFIGDLPWNSSRGDEHFINVLKNSGFRSSRICYTSVVRCFPSESRPPNESEITTCSKRFLFTELQLLKPKLFVALGSNTTSTLLGGKAKITEDRGRIFWIGPWPVLTTYSPAYVLRGRGVDDLQSDIDKAYAFVYGERR